MRTLACALLTFATASLHGASTLVDLTFDTLPSAQGFVYTQAGPHANDSEASQFAVDGTTLTQTTVGKGQGFSTPGNASYLRTFTEAETLGVTNFRFEMTARVTSHEQTRQDFSYGAFTQNIYLNNEGFYMGIKPGQLYINDAYFTPTGFDGSLFHDYRIDVDLEASTFEFFLDGTSVQSGTTRSFAATNSARLGDGTGTANADGERTSFTITTNVPEPTTALLSLVGALGLLRRKR
jgi:hypothetical protein